MMVLMALAMGKSGLGGALFSLPLMLVGVEAGGEAMTAASTCGALKTMYKESGCCGEPTKVSHLQVVAMPPTNLITAANPCVGTQPVDGPATGDGYFKNTNCTNDDETLNVLEQSGTDVTKGYKGQIDAMSRPPISTSYWLQGMCPVNVHWHLGAEHRSEGQYDENGKGPHEHRRLAEGKVRLGFRCMAYDENDAKFTTPYHWQYCKDMKVGETYEVHWPHSAAGACTTPFQYQTPFYDGVFCNSGIISLDPLNTYQKIGVQGQVFTIVNDEKYYYPDLIRGMIVDGHMGTDMAYYTGSTTGTSRNNEVCSRYTPITWQVDRKCHLISASSFDKMCADMLTQRDDMSGDVHPHGARELVLDKYAANNHQRL
jgi:hypothetical protein